MKSGIMGSLVGMHSIKKQKITGNIMRKYLAVFLFILLGVVEINAQQRIPIERAQREFQVRYRYVKYGFVRWPSAPNRPTPYFPKDGYYGDLSKNPDLSVQLVRDLAEKFFSSAKIYTLFYKYIDIEGLSDLSDIFYTDDDFNYINPESINKQNYECYLAILTRYMQDLKYQSINTVFNYFQGAIVGYGSANNMPDAITNATNDWDYKYSQNIYDYAQIGNRSKYYQTDTQISGNQTNYSVTLFSNYDWQVFDFRDVNSSVAIYFVLDQYADGPGNNWPWWAVGSGVFSLYGSYPGRQCYVFPPLCAAKPTGPVSFSDNGIIQCGWRNNNYIAIGEPYFDTTPDPIDIDESISALGTLRIVPGAASFKISLGTTKEGKSAGYIYYNEKKTMLANYPFSLRIITADSIPNPYFTNVVCPQGEVKIDPNRLDGPSSGQYYYYINCHAQNSGECYKKFRLDWFYCDGFPEGNFDLKITELNGTGSITNKQYYFHLNQVTSQWETEEISGVMNQSRQMTWNNYYSRTDTTTITNSSSQTIRKRVEEKYLYPWGIETLQTIDGESVSAITNQWSFYDNYSEMGYSQVKQWTGPSGGWKKYFYDSDGRLTNEVTQFGNNADTTLPEQNLESVKYYSTNGNYTEVTKWLGYEVGRQDYLFSTNRVEVRIYDGSRILTNVTERYDPVDWPVGNLKREIRPDGTMTLYYYSTNSVTNFVTTVLSGQPDTAGTNIIWGTKTIVIRGPMGQILSVETRAIQSSGEIEIGFETNRCDFLGRATNTVFLDGTWVNRTYDSFGLKSETSPEGILTEYFYDPANRPTTNRVYVKDNQFISAVKTLDQAGQLLILTKVGTNNQNRIISRQSFDKAGRVTVETNALGAVTTLSEGKDQQTGYWIKTNIFDNGATRYERFNQDGSLERVTGTAVHPVRYEYGVEQDQGTWRVYKKEIRLNSDLTDSTEWAKTYLDMLGRAYKKTATGGATVLSEYNSFGQLVREVDPDGIVKLYEYNALGEVLTTAIDVNQNGLIDKSGGADRVSQTLKTNLVVNSQAILRTESYVWTDSGLLKASTTDVTVDGNKQWQIKWDGSVGITNYSEVQINGSAHTKTNLVINADQSRTSSGYVYGQLLNVASQNGSGQSLGSSTYTYDEHGRQKTVTDARNGTTTYDYNNADQVTQVTTPVPGFGQSAQTTATYYDNLGRVAQVNYADGTYITNEYYASGELKKVLGSRASPVEYTYDSQGRVKTFKTWRESGNENTAATTTWNYDTRGLLLSKVYADNSSSSNFYTTGGRLYERVNGRNIKSVYTYNTAGDLYSVTYNDTNLTPGYTNSYDRLGQLTNVVRDSVSTAFTYNNLGQLLAESQSGGLLDTVKTTNFFDSLRRCTGIQALKGSTVLSDVDYGYESGSSRLSSVTSGDKSITYSYHTNSSLVDDIVSAQGSTTRLTVTKEYDFLNRLTSITSRGSSSLPLSSFAYEYDSANRRTRSVLADGSYWMYEYDSLGQLKNGKRYWSDFSPVTGQQYEYDHDLIGNRKTTGAGGNSQGRGLRQASYGVDAANKYSQRDVPSYADIIGMGSVNSAILVNNQRTERHAEYYRLELGINNSSGAAYEQVIVTDGTNSPSGYIFLPPSQESFVYDGDGNLVSDGRWTYSWNAENRLIGMQTVSTVAEAAKRKLAFRYDYKGRRIQKQVWNWSSGNWALLSDTRYVYDGWNLLAEYSDLGSQFSVLRTYTWGLDLSGTSQGAGGVGGLLMVSDVASTQTHHFTCFDGNGNIVALINAADGSITARYEYGPFGEVICITGPSTGSIAKSNPFRFSTKYADDETDLVYYGHRYYSPSLGRWISRDPIQEQGGFNLFGFVGNNSLNSIDPFGLDWVGITFASEFKDRNKDVRLLTREQVVELVGEEKVKAVNPNWHSFTVDSSLLPQEPSITKDNDNGLTAILDNIDDSLSYGQSRNVLLQDNPTGEELTHSFEQLWSDGKDATLFLLDLTPQNNFSAIFSGQTLSGTQLSAGERMVYVALTAGDATVVYKVASRALKRIKANKSVQYVSNLLKNESDNIIQVSSNTVINQSKYWKANSFNGVKVYQRNDLFDPNLMTSWKENGKIIRGTNLQRMSTGRAPIGYDGQSIVLHHTIQTMDSPIAELSGSFSQTYYNIIHINTGQFPSGINRMEFNVWREAYWINRANTYK